MKTMEGDLWSIKHQVTWFRDNVVLWLVTTGNLKRFYVGLQPLKNQICTVSLII